MSGSNPPPQSSSPDLSALYDQYFAVVPADTQELLDQAYALRYQVYCIENQFEDPATQVGEREMDPYDTHSAHAVLIYKPSGRVCGCVRLILPQERQGLGALPVYGLLEKSGQASLQRYPARHIAEISRYAVSKMFRRRQGETQYADATFFEGRESEPRRLVPHITLGLMQGVAKLAADRGITHVCATMEPALIRLLERFGLKFEAAGKPVEYHGIRVPCVAECEHLLAGMANRNALYYSVVGAAYHGGQTWTP